MIDYMCFFTKKSIAESIGESMAYFWSSFIGIGIANTFFMKYMYWYGLYFLKVLLTTLAVNTLMCNG